MAGLARLSLGRAHEVEAVPLLEPVERVGTEHEDGRGPARVHREDLDLLARRKVEPREAPDVHLPVVEPLHEVVELARVLLQAVALGLRLAELVREGRRLLPGVVALGGDLLLGPRGLLARRGEALLGARQVFPRLPELGVHLRHFLLGRTVGRLEIAVHRGSVVLGLALAREHEAVRAREDRDERHHSQAAGEGGPGFGHARRVTKLPLLVARSRRRRRLVGWR